MKLKTKIKKIKPRDLNIKDLIVHPRKSGVHKDLKKQANKEECREIGPYCGQCGYEDCQCPDVGF